MSNQAAPPCRVCAQPATHTLGAYALCDQHFAQATRERPHVWRAQALAVAGLLGLVIVATLIGAVAGRSLSGTPLLVVGLVIAILPAAAWMVLFYREDRVEPEPRGYVLGVMALGALLAAGLGIPLVTNVLQVGTWAGDSVAVQLAASVLGIGLVQASLIYAAVRASVYSSPEFDEATDGVIYGTAAGLGYATVLNVGLILDSGGAALSYASISAVLTALILAGAGGIVGHFLSGPKLRGRPVWWSAAGVALAAVVLGVYLTVRSVVAAGTLSVAGILVGPWIGLVIAVVIAAAVYALLTRIVRGEIARAIAAGGAQ
jgi:RsiW-degrading membrane proteinase PrsW (M82 family)